MTWLLVALALFSWLCACLATAQIVGRVGEDYPPLPERTQRLPLGVERAP